MNPGTVCSRRRSVRGGGEWDGLVAWVACSSHADRNTMPIFVVDRFDSLLVSRTDRGRPTGGSNTIAPSAGGFL